MATNKDWQVMQSTMLYRHLMARKKSKDGVVSVEVLDELIGGLEASMTDEEIRHVEAKVEKYSKSAQAGGKMS